MAAITRTAERAKKQRRSALTEYEERARLVLDRLVQWSGETNRSVGAKLDMDGESVRQRRRGEAALQLGEPERFANALDVGVECFGMTLDELAEWVYVDPRGRALLNRSSRCKLRWAS